MKQNQKKSIRKGFLYMLSILIILATAGGLLLLFANLSVYLSSKDRILTEKEATKLEDVDCILVLGAGVKKDGSPTHMLEDRILEGVSLYKLGASDVMIMSGDHGTEYYDEVNCMKNYAIEQGVASEDIFMDHAGFCTYDSMYRASHIFGIKRMIIVTQDYHMYRAIYDARKLGIDAYGVVSNPREYQGQTYRDIREILARFKDYFLCIKKNEAQIMGETISIEENGDITNDK